MSRKVYVYEGTFTRRAIFSSLTKIKKYFLEPWEAGNLWISAENIKDNCLNKLTRREALSIKRWKAELEESADHQIYFQFDSKPVPNFWVRITEEEVL